MELFCLSARCKGRPKNIRRCGVPMRLPTALERIYNCGKITRGQMQHGVLFRRLATQVYGVSGGPVIAGGQRCGKRASLDCVDFGLWRRLMQCIECRCMRHGTDLAIKVLVEDELVPGLLVGTNIATLQRVLDVVGEVLCDTEYQDASNDRSVLCD